MTEQEKRVAYFNELVDLIELYSFKRDLPVDEETADFFEKLKLNCERLDLDYEAFKKSFNIKEY